MIGTGFWSGLLGSPHHFKRRWLGKRYQEAMRVLEPHCRTSGDIAAPQQMGGMGGEKGRWKWGSASPAERVELVELTACLPDAAVV